MFKKIHSNRPPGVSLLGEIKKEFGVYFLKLEMAGKSFANRHPEFIFRLMIAMMVVSLALSFTVFRDNRRPNDGQKLPVKKVPLNTGFDQILSTGAALKRTIILKAQVDSISGLSTLSSADSTRLEKDLDELRTIHTHLNN